MSADPEAAPAERRIARRRRVGAPAPGFAGPGHTAAEVVRADALTETDPFVLLMDDRLDFAPGQPVGEAHPHAGIETVTLLLEGSLDDPAVGLLQQGDVEWMTAGSGIVHNTGVRATGRARILQLWIALPRGARGAGPEVQIVPFSALPVRREPGVEARLYSGRTGALVSPTRNRAPVTMVDFTLAPGASATQDLPGTYTGFFYVIDGSLWIGGEDVSANEVAWLDRDGAEIVRLQAGAARARAILYAGQPLHEPIVQRGPFVAGSEEELSARYRAYRSGAFPAIGQITTPATS